MPRRRWRKIVRWCSLLAAALLALRVFPSAPRLVPSLSPFVALCSLVALKSALPLALLALAVLVLAILRKRWFCRYACPVGILEETVGRLHPSAAKRWQRLPRVGLFVFLVTLGGAVLGFPVLLWLDPLGMFNGFVNAWRIPGSAAALAAGSILPLVLLLGIVLPHAWCGRICPLGAMQELVHVRIRKPVPAAVTGNAGAGMGLARRAFLGAGAGAVGMLTARAVCADDPRLRPPGAVDEPLFRGLCIRCGNCIAACPPQIIRPELGLGAVTCLLTPALHFDRDYCREDCQRCSEVCPSGSLTRLAPAEKRAWRIGLAVVELPVCRLFDGQECNACVVNCPYEAVAISAGLGGFDTAPRVDAARCNGCGACESVCPVRPRRAIRVMPAIARRLSS